MKRFLLLIILIISCSFLHAQIDVSNTSFTVQQLVEDVLIDSPCATTSNWMSSTGIIPAQAININGIGFFERGMSNFPFERGVVLSTGSARSAGMRNPGNGNDPNFTLNEGGGFILPPQLWAGDNDLENIAGLATGDTFNASSISFDFVSQANQISFNFIFASEEYNQLFECQFSDAFAFILTDAAGNSRNLAVVPNTNISITTMTIRPQVAPITGVSTGCNAQNAQFFDRYNFGANAATSAIDFNGQTVSLVARGDVVPGESYTIKLVIADQSDGSLDSAVFLEAGSFNLGGSLGEDRTIEAGNPGCDGTPIILDATIDGATYNWFVFNTTTNVFEPLPDDTNPAVNETDPTTTVNISGVYRVEGELLGTCTFDDEITIQFITPPIIESPPEDLQACDEGGDGSETFNLEINTPLILGAQDPDAFVISYHLTQDGADNNTGNLNAAAYTNTQDPQEIFVRIADLTQTCFVTDSFMVSTFILTIPVLDDIVQCDIDQDGIANFILSDRTLDAIGTNDSASVTVTYHLTQIDADTSNAPLPDNSFNNISNPQEIFVRLQDNDNSNCFVTSSFNLIVNLPPVINAVANIEICDNNQDGDDTNGIVEFDLSLRDANLLNGQANVIVESYHTNRTDAEVGINALPLLYTNVIPNREPVFIRLRNTMTNCLSVATFDLLVNPLPIVSNVDLLQCDVDGIPDGFTIYNLDEANIDVINGGNTADFTFTYYLNLADAQNENNPQNPSPFTTTVNPQTLFVTVANNTTFCSRIAEVTLTTTATNVSNASLTLCDDNRDGSVVFTLSDGDTQVLTAAPAGLNVAYYLTLQDAQLEQNSLPNRYLNVANPQILFARVENANACFGISTLELNVNELPPENILTDFVVCDDDDIFTFNLNTKDNEILGGLDPANFTISYHETDLDANTDVNRLNQNFTNTSNPQTITARFENNMTGCFIITSFNLMININPIINSPSLIEICDDDVVDGFTTFDLTLRNNEIIGDQTDVEVQYYLSQDDADTGRNPLPDLYTNIVNPQLIFVRIENTNTNCFTTNNTTLELIVQQGAEANLPTPLEVCDEIGGNDGIAQFDLTTLDDEVLGTQDPNQYRVTYHLTENDAEVGLNEITGAFTNSSNPQTVFVRVTNIPIGCFNTTTATLVVNLLPEPNLADSALLCVDESGDVLNAPTLDTELPATGFNYVWQFNGVQLPNENNPFLVANEAGIYSVTITNVNTRCENTDEIEVERSSPPITFSAQLVTPAFAQNNRIEVSVIGEGDYQFSIDDSPFQVPAFFENVSPGNHIITIQDVNGCGSVTLNVFVIDYPRFFTPNGDGINDTWNIIGGERLNIVNLFVFDKFGKLISQINSASQGWDGFFNGQQLPSTDYWFSIDFIENNISRRITGHFALKR